MLVLTVGNYVVQPLFFLRCYKTLTIFQENRSIHWEVEIWVTYTQKHYDLTACFFFLKLNMDNFFHGWGTTRFHWSFFCRIAKILISLWILHISLKLDSWDCFLCLKFGKSRSPSSSAYRVDGHPYAVIEGTRLIKCMQTAQPLLSTNVYPSLTPPTTPAVPKDPRRILRICNSLLFPTAVGGGCAEGLASGTEENSLCTGTHKGHLGP